MQPQDKPGLCPYQPPDYNTAPTVARTLSYGCLPSLDLCPPTINYPTIQLSFLGFCTGHVCTAQHSKSCHCPHGLLQIEPPTHAKGENSVYCLASGSLLARGMINSSDPWVSLLLIMMNSDITLRPGLVLISLLTLGTSVEDIGIWEAKEWIYTACQLEVPSGKGDGVDKMRLSLNMEPYTFWTFNDGMIFCKGATNTRCLKHSLIFLFQLHHGYHGYVSHCFISAPIF